MHSEPFLDTASRAWHNDDINHDTDEGLIIMTRTIITADGMRLREEGTTRRLIRRAFAGALIIIGLLLLSAAVIGFVKAATHTDKPITHTQNHTASFNDGVNTELQDLQQMARRPAHTSTNPDGSKISDPNGITLISECLSDTTLTVDELGICLAQPSN